jgi:hypothetical protein
MNYLKQIVNYWKQHREFNLGKNECYIYMYLLDVFNESGWPATISMRSSIMMKEVDLTHKPFKVAITNLKEAGLIAFDLKNGSPKIEFQLVDFSAETFGKNSKVTNKTFGKISKVEGQTLGEIPKVEPLTLGEMSKVENPTLGVTFGKISKVETSVPYIDILNNKQNTESVCVRENQFEFFQSETELKNFLLTDFKVFELAGKFYSVRDRENFEKSVEMFCSMKWPEASKKPKSKCTQFYIDWLRYKKSEFQNKPNEHTSNPKQTATSAAITSTLDAVRRKRDLLAAQIRAEDAQRDGQSGFTEGR